MMEQLAPLTALVVTVDRACETSHLFLIIIWNIIGIVPFISTNKFNVYIDIDKAYISILFTKK